MRGEVLRIVLLRKIPEESSLRNGSRLRNVSCVSFIIAVQVK